MNKSVAALTRCSNYSPDTVTAALNRQFQLLGGVDKFVKPGDTVLIKPNFIAPRSARYATQTHPALILALARLLKDHSAKPFVGDSPAWQNVFACIDKLQLTDPLRELDVPVKQLDSPVTCRIGNDRMHVKLSKVALDADVIINLPKFKSHQQLVATFAVKNMFGCVPGKRKAIWHFRKGANETDFCKLLIGIYRKLDPALTIIDGVKVMDGQGPIRGRTRPLGWLIGSTDPIACETICAKLINADSDRFPIIRTARQINFGCRNIDEIRIVGDEYADHICTDFKHAEHTPIRFSFPRICKSIAKQLMLTLRRPQNKSKAQ